MRAWGTGGVEGVWTRVFEYALENPLQLTQHRVMEFLEECIDALLMRADATHQRAIRKTSRPTGRMPRHSGARLLPPRYCWRAWSLRSAGPIAICAAEGCYR